MITVWANNSVGEGLRVTVQVYTNILG